jgi:uncharacterized membrane protein YeaQ/YmgE (transglycosylase-associated protein family)
LMLMPARALHRDMVGIWQYRQAKTRFFRRADCTGMRRSLVSRSEHGASPMGILWIIIVGFVAGIIARLLAPGPNKPTGFILTTVLGIAGAFLATFIGQAVGWYRPGQGAGFIAATVGAIAVLFIWNRLVAARVVGDPGVR